MFIKIENNRVVATCTDEQPWTNNYFEGAELGDSIVDGVLVKNIDRYLSAKRDEILSIEIEIPISNERTVVLINDDRTKVNISFKLSTLNADTSISTLAYECRNGWFDLNNSDYQSIMWSLDSYTQKVFNALRVIYENHSITPYPNPESAVNAFIDEVNNV